MGGVDDEGIEIVHPAKSRRLLERPEQFPHAKAIEPRAIVRVRRSSGSDGCERTFARERRATFSVCEPQLEHEILPFLQDRRRRVPKEWMLPHNRVVLAEELLLVFHINKGIRIHFVEVVKGDSWQGPHGFNQVPVHPGTMQGGVGKEDQHTFWHRRAANKPATAA